MKTLDFQIMVGELKRTTKEQANGVLCSAERLCDASRFCCIGIGYMAVFPERTESIIDTDKAALALGLTTDAQQKLVYLNDVLKISFKKIAYYMETFSEDFITEGQALPIPIDGSEKKS